MMVIGDRRGGEEGDGCHSLRTLLFGRLHLVRD